jgi:hypothetical protein
MILPDSEAGALHAERRVTTLSGLKSANRLATSAAIAGDADSNGIIQLTFTA